MSGNEFSGEQELSELARLLPVPAARDLPAGRQRILQEHLMTELHPMEPKSRPRAAGQHRKRRYGLVAVAGSAALAAAVVVTVLQTGQANPARPTSVPKARATPTAPETAAVLLAKVAEAAASQPAPTVRDSQFMYIRSAESDEAGQKPYERQVWLPVANICVPGLLKEGGSTQPLSPFPVKVNPNGSEKVEYPSKPSDWNNYNFRCPSEGHLSEVSYRLLQSLPTNPNALLNWLKSQAKYTNDGPLQEIFETLGENIMPPAVAAAFYHLAAQFPGATLVPDATDAIGQHGIGVTWPSPNPGRVDQNELIFDKKTLQNIGEKQFDAKTGRVDFEVAIQQRAFVDKAGELPQRTH
jgi:hypothetical protein